MKYVYAALAVAGLALAQDTAPGAVPDGCTTDYNGQFEITIVKPSGATKRDLETRASTCGQTGILTLNLAGSQLHDADGRTGYIASNNSQFQFDKPVQAGGIYQKGFSVCKNGSIALGPTTTFYQCQSGSFYNLYYSNIGAQCEPVNIDIIPCDGSSAGAAAGAEPVSASADGQPEATAPVTAAPVSVYTDGQPQVTASASQVPVSEFTDGQPQATGSASQAVVSEFTDGQPQATAQPTIVAAGAAHFGVSGAMFAAVAAGAAALL